MFRCLITAVLFIHFNEAYGVRPFITDDARVVGYRLGQWETWLRLDKHAGEQWHMFAYGPHRKVELSLGGVAGLDKPESNKKHFSYALPLVQGKYLFKEYGHRKGPGYALVAGSFLPGGRGVFVPEGYGAFAFMNISQCFGKHEDLLIHANLGSNYLYLNKENNWVNTWGFGMQARTYRGFHLVGEVFSGDPYIPGTGLAWQAGFRHFISDLIQVDATLGKGISGSTIMPLWFSIGARFVTTRWEQPRKRAMGFKF